MTGLQLQATTSPYLTCKMLSGPERRPLGELALASGFILQAVLGFRLVAPTIFVKVVG